MTTFRENSTHSQAKLTLAEILEIFAAGQLPLKFTAYDGSTAGPEDAALGLDLKTPRGTTYLATADRRLSLPPGPAPGLPPGPRPGPGPCRGALVPARLRTHSQFFAACG